MKNTERDTLMGNLAEMRLIVEGALSIYEKSDRANDEAFSLIGEALYMMRSRIMECTEAGLNTEQ